MHESGGIGDRAVKGEEVGQRTSRRGTRDPLQKSSRVVSDSEEMGYDSFEPLSRRT